MSPTLRLAIARHVVTATASLAVGVLIGYLAGGHLSPADAGSPAFSGPTGAYVVSVGYRPGATMAAWADFDPQGPIHFRVYFADRAAYDTARQDVFLLLTERKNAATITP